MLLVTYINYYIVYTYIFYLLTTLSLVLKIVSHIILKYL